jgi:uncharacterized protein YbjT (DUF2867 family)
MMTTPVRIWKWLNNGVGDYNFNNLIQTGRYETMKISSVCVLGGSGFVGSHLVHQLSAWGIMVIVPTRHRETAKHLLPLPGTNVVEADILDQTELAHLIKNQDAVVNLVGILHERLAGDFNHIHAELPQKLVAACRQAGVVRLLHMSALGADSASPSAYQRSKADGEKHVRDAKDIRTTIFQPSVIFGRKDSFLNLFARILKIMPVLPLADAGARFQPIWVEDVARAFTLALDNSKTYGQLYPLCGPKAYTLREMVEFVASHMELRRRILPLGKRLSWLQAMLMEFKPGNKLMTRDNHYAMQRDNVCSGPFPEVFGFTPSALETVSCAWLSADMHNRHDAYRNARR